MKKEIWARRQGMVCGLRWIGLAWATAILLASQASATYRIPSGVTLVPASTPIPGTQVSQSTIVNDTQFAYLLWLPPGYDSTGTKKWPCLIAMPAYSFSGTTGNQGSYTTDHDNNAGPAFLLQTPSAYPYLSNRFVVVTPYLAWEVYGSDGGGQPARLHCLLAYLNTRLKIDTTLISMMGYCFGSGISYNMSTAFPNYASHLVLMAGNDNWASTFDLTKACNVKNILIRQYASHNCSCGDSATAQAAYNAIRACGNTHDSITFTPSDLHEIWYWDGLDTTQSIYDWMLTPRLPTAIHAPGGLPTVHASPGLDTRLSPGDRMEIIDVNGKVLCSLGETGARASSVVSRLGRGLYLIRIKAGTNTIARIYVAP